MIETIKAQKESKIPAPKTMTAPTHGQSPASNDHILHELEARYGEIVAWWIVQRLPKTKVGK